MKEIDVSEKNLDSIIFTLLAARANNESVFCRFRGHIFYSDSITFDSAYQQVYGVTREEYDNRLFEMFKSHDELGISDSSADIIEMRKDIFRAVGVVYPEDEGKKIK